MPQNKIIAVEDLWLSYTDKYILEDINLDIYQGDFLLVTGPNGGGKTSLLRTIMGLQKPTEGKVTFFKQGEKVSSLDIGYLPQKNSIDSRFPITVKEVIESGLMGTKKEKGDRPGEKIDAILDLMGISVLRNKPIGVLSGGQLQRALFGRALIANPEILILDEPVSYIDRQFGERMFEILREQSSRGTTIMMVSHDIAPFITLSNRNLYIDHTLGDR
ncbi:MAG TPA: ATP-binding cassette domain-containing protein [Candidatus Barnesiella excrementigallinarum]|nr:ATP-binding cassette domain-containing protein [Candidatus Barnesiella excrementigallinarum]